MGAITPPLKKENNMSRENDTKKIYENFKVDLDSVLKTKPWVLDFRNEKVLTDQSDKETSNINNIMKTYLKTGMLPVKPNIQAIYADVSAMPTLESIHTTLKTAQESFLSIHPHIRAMINNNPANLAEFIVDPKNHDILQKYGLMKNRQDVDTNTAHEAPSKQENSSVQSSEGTNSNPN